MFSILNIVIAVIAAVLGLALGPLSCKILNKIPAEWLCDYDEKPSEELLSGRRFAVGPTGIVMGIVLAVIIAVTVFTNGASVEFIFIFLLFEVLMLISAADAKYTIIPDQFTAAAAVISVAFAVVDFLTKQNFIGVWYSPLLGALSGAGLLTVLDLLSTLLFKREGFGFGDIKLLAALGFFFGFPYTAVMLILSFLVAAVHFLILIFSGKARKGIYLPMGPYICIAAALTVIFRSQFQTIFNLYNTLLTMSVLP